MAHDLRKAAFKNAVHQVVRHGACDLFLSGARTVDKRAALDPMRYQPLDLHLAQHGGNGGVGEVSWAAQAAEDVGDGCFPALPEDFHDTQLEITESEHFAADHNYRTNTTTVVVLSNFFCWIGMSWLIRFAKPSADRGVEQG